MYLRSVNDKFEYIAVKLRIISLELLRIICGLMMVFGHGYAKMFGDEAQPFTGGKDFFGIDVGINMLWLAGIIEFYVGILIVLGLFTRWASFLMVILMVMAYLSSHLAWFPTINGGELAMAYFLIFLTITAYGPGPFSLDVRLFGKSQDGSYREKSVKY